MYTTRIAPSPTGDMHLGTARTALFNWLAARASDGKFILRIDDTDTSRNTDGAIKVIFDCLDWLGLDYDEVHFQSKRMDRYREVADDLLEHGEAYMKDGALLLNANRTPSWHDTIAGDVTPNSDEAKMARTTVLMRSDGTPTYHFASCIDDMDMGVNWVIRGIDHFTNTHRHATIMSYVAANKPLPKFTHLGLITKDKKKLSKRDGDASFLKFIDDGYSPEAMLDYMMRLGWGPKGGKDPKIITGRDALNGFFDGNLKASPAGFDRVKLDSLDRRHKARRDG